MGDPSEAKLFPFRVFRLFRGFNYWIRAIRSSRLPEPNRKQLAKLWHRQRIPKISPHRMEGLNHEGNVLLYEHHQKSPSGATRPPGHRQVRAFPHRRNAGPDTGERSFPERLHFPFGPRLATAGWALCPGATDRIRHQQPGPGKQSGQKEQSRGLHQIRPDGF